jgi:hypothetical protein
MGCYLYAFLVLSPYYPRHLALVCSGPPSPQHGAPETLPKSKAKALLWCTLESVATLKMYQIARHWWLTPVTVATQET